MERASIATVAMFDAQSKHQSVASIIASYAKGHQLADVGINVASLFVPAGGLLGMAASMAIQAPAVYQPLARKIGKTYLSGVVDGELGQLIDDVAIEGGVYDIGATFGVEFLQMVALELLQELGIGAAVAAVPLIGTVFAGFLDAKIAATMTWRVGLTAAMYFENGCMWLGSQHQTYERAKLLAGELSSKSEGRYNLDDLTEDAELRNQQVNLLARYAKLLIDLVGVGSVAEVLRTRHKVDPKIVDAVLREVRARRIDEGRPSAAAPGERRLEQDDPSVVDAVNQFISGMRAIGMDTSKIVHLAHDQGLDGTLVELLLNRS